MGLQEEVREEHLLLLQLHLHEKGREAYVSIQRRAENINAMSRLTLKIKILYHTQRALQTQGLSEMAAQEGESMDKGELTLYRNTYNAGKRDALEEYVDRVKKTIDQQHEDTDLIKKEYVIQILDKYLKEALEDETGRSSQT
jgi:hypothetical protein